MYELESRLCMGFINIVGNRSTNTINRKDISWCDKRKERERVCVYLL